MSKVRADNISNRADDGAPALTYGAEIPVGIAITGAGNINVGGAATISGNINVGGAATISGNLNVGGAATISGNLSVGGTLTYEDVTNIDSVGVITARSGIRVGAGESIGSDGAAVVYYGDGSNLDGVVSGIELEQAGSSVGTSVTAINFASGATLTSVSSGISTVTIAAGLNTTAATVSGIVTFLSLDDAQDHKLTISGISTISCTGGSEGDSHIVRIVNSGITTVGFSTFFLFPSGSTPSLPTADGAISLISFTVHRVGAAGTQLLAGASVNYS
jgi:hypothetical protein|tara:strand:+ start:33 stop:860 length:828 start_codon:yes stop_codon:yes gene_type:complete